MSVGRKERWTPEDYMEVVRLIADGVPLNEALGKTRPAKTAFFTRLREDAELAKAYGIAQSMRAQTRIQKIEEFIGKLETGKIDPSSAKVAIDALKWLSAKEDPRYADVQRSEITGRDGERLIPDQPKMDDRETARLLAYLLSRGQRAIEERGELTVLPDPAT